MKEITHASYINWSATIWTQGGGCGNGGLEGRVKGMMSVTNKVDVEEHCGIKTITYRRNGDSRKGKRVADYIACVDAAAPILSRVLHFAQGW